MIKFKKVKMHNFLAFTDAELPLDRQGLVLIEGENLSSNAYDSNGSGKSSLLSSITYAIYGKTVTNESGDEVIKVQAGTDCYVYLYFVIGKTPYRIERYRKGKHGNKNKLKLFANDKEITAATMTKTQALIDKLINIDFTTYVNTISYGQGDIPIFSKATDKGKKEILESLANIGIYEEARQLASSKAKDARVEADSLNSQINILKANREQYINLREQETAKYAEVTKRKEELKKSFAIAQEKLKESTPKYEQAVKDIEAKIKEVKVPNLSKLRDNAYALDSIASKTEQSISKQEYDKTALLSSIKDMKRQYNDTYTTTNCPVCGAPLDSEHRKKELYKLALNMKDTAKKISEIDAQIGKLNLDYKKQLKKAQEAKEKLHALDNKIQQAQNMQQTLYFKKNQLDNKYDSIKQEVSIAKSSLASLMLTKPKDYKKEIAGIDHKLEAMQIKVDTSTKNSYTYNELATKVFSRQGIPSMVLDLATPFINERANHYLTILSGSALRLTLKSQTLNADKTLSDKIDLEVTNLAGDSSYKKCSAGERKRIDIALALAIQDLQQSHSNMAVNLGLYDECFEGLDTVGCESVVEILKQKAKELGTVFVITHNEALKPLFDTVITVSKNRNGQSSIKGRA